MLSFEKSKFKEMKTLIAYRPSSKLKTLLAVLISLTFIPVWLPFLRSIFDGRSYEWGASYFGFQINGAGVTPGFIFFVIQFLFYVALLISMFHIRNRLFYYLMLAIWFIHVFGNLLSDIIMNGDTMFHGDTLGVHVSLTWIVIPLSLLGLLLILFEIKADQKAGEQFIPWTTKNRNLLWLIMGPLPFQAVLFASGEPHGLTDQIGVIIAIAQCFLIPMILRPYKSTGQTSGIIWAKKR